eukprot:COSAG02_NODE_246_length_27291_cov_105.654200_20_plen_78_part_00
MCVCVCVHACVIPSTYSSSGKLRRIVLGASSGVLCARVGEKGGRCGDGARTLLAQQVDFGVVSEQNVRLLIGSGLRH